MIHLLEYLIPWILILIPVRLFTKIPDYIFRKLLHLVAFSSVAVMILRAQSWQEPCFTSILFALLVYPILSVLEKKPWYSRLFVEKSRGEIKRSLMLLFGMFAFLIWLAWGVLDKPLAAATAIMMWGVGDGMAAMIGIPLGKHKLYHKKSVEGSLAMLMSSFLVGLVMLRQFFPAMIAALLGTVTELFSPSEYDTVTVPLVIAAVLLL